MNAKMKTMSNPELSRIHRENYNSRENPCYLDRYSRYDLEWIQFLVDSRKLKDGTHEDPCEPEILPNVWNAPQH